ncbi:MAG: hypothetical protein WC382_13520 [Methanoregulaceae archaeon]
MIIHSHDAIVWRFLSMKPDYDRKRISTIISDIELYQRDLRELGISGTGDLDDKTDVFMRYP